MKIVGIADGGYGRGTAKSLELVKQLLATRSNISMVVYESFTDACNAASSNPTDEIDWVIMRLTRLRHGQVGCLHPIHRPIAELHPVARFVYYRDITDTFPPSLLFDPLEALHGTDFYSILQPHSEGEWPDAVARLILEDKD